METRLPVPQFDPPLLNAAGSLGFVPDLHAGIPWEKMGAFVTNPISYQPRKPAGGARIADVAGGILMHTGYFNPGFRKAIKRFSKRWENSPLPVIVHLLADESWAMEKMSVALETIENLIAVEVGFPADVDEGQAAEILAAAAGELPLIARVSLPRVEELSEALLSAGASAICLGPPRGAAVANDQKMIIGRLYGPGVIPQALYITKELVRRGVPVISGGGVYSPGDADALMAAGALAVQVDTALWRGDWL